MLLHGQCKYGTVTLSPMTLGIVSLIVTLSIVCNYTDFNIFTEILCVILLSVIMLSVVMLSVVMLSVVMLSIIMLSVVMLSVVMLSVVMLSVVMLSVMARRHCFREHNKFLF
jgi:hypothetical protein